MKTYARKEELPDELVQMLVQMMRSQAYRELAAAQMFGAGLRYVPELRWLKFLTWHIREEMEHYEAVAKTYQDFAGESVEPWVRRRLSESPISFAESWFELAMAQYLYDRGGFWQLREYEECSFLPFRAMVGKILREEAGHQDLGERIVVELCVSGEHEAEKQRHFEKWLRQGLLSFGRPATPGARRAIEVGFKKRDPGLVMQDFLDDIKPAMRRSNLRFPEEPSRALAMEFPPDLDWSLDAG